MVNTYKALKREKKNHFQTLHEDLNNGLVHQCLQSKDPTETETGGGKKAQGFHMVRNAVMWLKCKQLSPKRSITRQLIIFFKTSASLKVRSVSLETSLYIFSNQFVGVVYLFLNAALASPLICKHCLQSKSTRFFEKVNYFFCSFCNTSV